MESCTVALAARAGSLRTGESGHLCPSGHRPREGAAEWLMRFTFLAITSGEPECQNALSTRQPQEDEGARTDRRSSDLCGVACTDS